MTDFSVVSIDADRHSPRLMIRRFQDGSANIYQANKYQRRHGKTIYLTREQFLKLRLHFVEEME